MNNVCDQDDALVELVFWPPLLHLAVQQGALKCVTWLVTSHTSPNNYLANYNGGLPIHKAMERGHSNIAEVLLQNGSSVNDVDDLGRTPLHICCQKGHLHCTQLLLRNSDVDINCPDAGGFTPLMSVLLRKRYYFSNIHMVNTYLEIISCLLISGANPNIMANNGVCALHISVYLNNTPVLERLLNAKDINPDIRFTIDPATGEQTDERQGPTPVWFTIEHGHMHAAYLLVKANADPGLPCKKHRQKRHLSKREVFLDVMMYLHFKGPSPDMSGVGECVEESISRSLPHHSFTGIYRMAVNPFSLAINRLKVNAAQLLMEAGYYPSMAERHGIHAYIKTMKDSLLHDPLDIEAMQLISNRLQEPLPLQWWCRRVVRNRLPKGMSRFNNALYSLRVPKRFTDYIRLEGNECKHIFTYAYNLVDTGEEAEEMI